VTVDAAPCEGRARLVVSDTGEGIPAAALPGIFDRYYRTERTGGGQRAGGHGGLGLMIARRIVDLHQGTLRIATDGSGPCARAWAWCGCRRPSSRRMSARHRARTGPGWRRPARSPKSRKC